MKTMLTPFLLLTVLLSACNSTATEPVTQTQVSPDGKGEKYESTNDPSLTWEQTVNDDGSVNISIYWAGDHANTLVGTIEKEAPADGYEVVLFKQTKDYAYIAINKTGFGGYILYGGANDSLYRLDLATNELSLIFQAKNNSFATDVSPDGNGVAVITSNEQGEILLTLDGAPYPYASYTIPSKYMQAGDAVFSPDGSKLAYAATIPPVGMGFEPNTGTDLEKTVIYIIDLSTGDTKEFKQVDGLINSLSWTSGEEPTIE